MREKYEFTSECVSKGHPDKIADQISDAILDEALSKDQNSRVACETSVTANHVDIKGEIKTTATINYKKLTKDLLIEIGYDNDELGLNGHTANFINYMRDQSSEISHGVENEDPKLQGAGDQGIMFGYATSETSAYIPATLYYSRKIILRLDELRRSGKYGLRPDAKSQVTLEYRNGVPFSVKNIVTSTQHDPIQNLEEIRELVKNEVIDFVFPSNWIRKDTLMHINPAGKFTNGGPASDAGLTGRKIIVDTYGGFGQHGGGAFSGKDPSKVDRSGAYAARQVALSLVANGYADKCLVQLSYAIGISEPTSIYINTYGTGKRSDEFLEKMVRDHIDLTPWGIIDRLKLNRPIYKKTASFGHFGREDVDLPWEKPISI